MKGKLFLPLIMLIALVLAGMVSVPGSTVSAAKPKPKPKPRISAWVKTGSMHADRYMHTATLLLNGKVLVAGGINNSETTATSELYTPTTGKWSKTGSLSTRRVNDTATLLPNGKVLVVGGAADNGGNGNALATAELYNPRTGKWSKTGSLSSGRYIHTATLLSNGQVLVVGGTEDNHADGDGLATAELYNSRTGTWSTTGSMASSRVDFTATRLPDGKVLVAGGDAAGTAELYDPTDGTWSTTDSMTMSTSRYKHTATLLPNGKVLVAGGAADNSGGDALNTAELYNPTDGTWSMTDPMSTGRLSHTETLLLNKKVLVVGGWNVDSLATAEVFSAPK